MKRAIADQLRQVWNARGDADLTRINEELSTQLGTIGYSVSTINTAVADAIRSLDR